MPRKKLSADRETRAAAIMRHVMVKTCYWGHGTEIQDCFICIDGENMVCAQCCVENCPVETPDFFARCTALGHPTWPATSQSRPVPAKLVCLESYWTDELFLPLSVKGFLEALRPLVSPPLQLAHRFTESKRGLAYYTKRPNGILWKEPAAWDAPIFYLAFHGSPGTIDSVLDYVGAEALCNAFTGYGAYPNLVYFGACSVLRGRRGHKFARDFLRASGSRAVIGYTTDIAWMASLITDILFLHRFYNDEDPWGHLERIFNSVLKDFPPAKELGYTLVCGEE